MTAARETIEKRIERTQVQSKEAAAWAKKSERAAVIAATVKLAESESPVVVSAHELDHDPILLNVANGTLDLRTGELRPHSRADLITKLSSVSYHPAARCPRFLKFLAEVFEPHPDLVPFIQRAAGYSLTGDTREQCLFLAHGVGRNGKSTLLQLLQALLGRDYSATLIFLPSSSAAVMMQVRATTWPICEGSVSSPHRSPAKERHWQRDS